MGDEVSPNGQGSNDQPPPWLQAFAQQMMQTVNLQMNEMTQQMRQRMDTIEQQVQGQSAPPTVQATPTTTPVAAPLTVPSPQDIPVPAGSTIRPRHKLPEMKMFTGKRSDWRAWKTKMEQKLERDHLAIGDAKDQFAYIDACLDDTPAKMVLAYVERQRKNSSEDPSQFMTYLNNIYGDTNTKERAVNKLNTMSQGKEAFTTFLPKFETTLADAGGGEWTDEVKINHLKRALSQEMRKSFIYMPAQPTEYGKFIDSMQTLASRLTAFDRESRKPTAPTAPKPTPASSSSDAMDWEPSISKVQAPASSSEQKRAQWVTKEVLDGRKAANQCLRCGRGGHFISSCKLLPAQPPRPAQGKARVKTVEVDDDTTVVELVEGSDQEPESGKE